MSQVIAAAADLNAPPVTKTLAEFVSTHPSQGWSAEVEHEAHRTFLNWLGCAIGAAQHESVTSSLAAVQEFQPAPQASILGRKERVDMGGAALVNGISSHTFDFDDTHLKTVIHPAGPVASAILALGEHINTNGRQIIDAMVLGIDVECRVGNAMYPDHYHRGWHITGSTGMLGSAAACARILGLDTHKTIMALGIAASQPIGMREQFGTMTKPFHPGAAARAGQMSALLAKHAFTASLRALEAGRGYMQTVSTKNDWSEIDRDLGKSFEISLNTYKPFACGIVIHPAIDACAQLRAQGVKADDVERIELRVHPLVLELTGKKTPKTGLEGKFSVYHGCAMGLMFGQAGEGEYDDDLVNRADVVALRAKVNATTDTNISEASVDVTAILKDGKEVHVFVKNAIGSVENPMSDTNLEQKFTSLAEPIIGKQKTAQLISALWNLGKAADLKQIIQLSTPN
ncbi:MmgE/PrpD family protein [Polynucleobacter paneuropaeus]|nr:MmgE/PrpD family protein [Polynucleobacter paneuropaeus]